jgi:hypothetical protein
MRTLVGALALVALAACGGAGSKTAPTTNPRASCVTISEAAKSTLAIPVTGATKAPADIRGGARWYYSTSSGATWVSGVDPATGEANSPTLPVNEKARQTSDVGIAVTPGAPAFGTASDVDPAAGESRRCAAP